VGVIDDRPDRRLRHRLAVDVVQRPGRRRRDRIEPGIHLRAIQRSRQLAQIVHRGVIGQQLRVLRGDLRRRQQHRVGLRAKANPELRCELRRAYSQHARGRHGQALLRMQAGRRGRASQQQAQAQCTER
jgi:hypothetical protein